MTSAPVFPAEVAWMRGLARTHLGSRAVILRATEVDTETGTTIVWLPTAAVSAGVRDPSIGAETILAARVQQQSVVAVLLPLYDDQGQPVEVRAQDRLGVTVTDLVTGDSTTVVVSVTGVVGRFSEWPVLQRVVGQVQN